MPADPTKPEPWERQPGESAPAFSAFAAYRDMTDRSLRAVGQKLGKCRALMERWSAAWDWVDRVSAWDGHRDALRRDETTRQDALRRDRWNERRDELLEREHEIGEQLLRQAALISRFPIARTVVTADGTTIEPIAAADVRRAGVIAHEGSALCRGAIEAATQTRIEPPPVGVTTTIATGDPAPLFIEVRPQVTRTEPEAPTKPAPAPAPIGLAR